jgi:hypothetical protein
VGGGVTVGGFVAAADVATLETDPQVEPLLAGGQAVLAAVDGLRELDYHDVAAVLAENHPPKTPRSAGLRHRTDARYLVIVAEFPTTKALEDRYASPEYAEAFAFRGAPVNRRMIFVAGIDEPADRSRVP